MYSCSLITELRRNTTSTAESWRGTGMRIEAVLIGGSQEVCIDINDLPNPVSNNA